MKLLLENKTQLAWKQEESLHEIKILDIFFTERNFLIMYISSPIFRFYSRWDDYENWVTVTIVNTTGFLKQKGPIIKHLSIVDKVDTHSNEHVKQSLVEWDHNKAFLSHLLLELLLLTINNYANTTHKTNNYFFFILL